MFTLCIYNYTYKQYIHIVEYDIFFIPKSTIVSFDICTSKFHLSALTTGTNKKLFLKKNCCTKLTRMETLSWKRPGKWLNQGVKKKRTRTEVERVTTLWGGRGGGSIWEKLAHIVQIANLVLGKKKRKQLMFSLKSQEE